MTPPDPYREPSAPSVEPTSCPACGTKRDYASAVAHRRWCLTCHEFAKEREYKSRRQRAPARVADERGISMAARGAVERVALRGSTGTETFGGKRGPTHEERWIAPKDFPRAQQEVAWFFGSGESAMGAKGQAFAGGGSHVFDEDASARLHESMQSPKHRGDVDRYIRIWRTMRGIDKPVRDLLAVAYLAHAWDHILRTAFESKRFGVTLVGAVLVGELAATEYDTHCAKNEKAESRKLHGFAGMIAWLVDEVRPQVVKGIETHRRPKRFDLMQSEAESRVQAALSVYDDARRARVAAERKADAERIARLVGDMR